MSNLIKSVAYNFQGVVGVILDNGHEYGITPDSMVYDSIHDVIRFTVSVNSWAVGIAGHSVFEYTVNADTIVGLCTLLDSGPGLLGAREETDA